MLNRDYGVEIHRATDGKVKVMTVPEEDRLMRQGRDRIALCTD
jgi:hypothetical protein